ncbi:MAG: lysine--tRNA ligase [Candidatus Gracilibacteria bacterium]|nr:lysine--tRNA ligase [Candidatus Gracilibacteria bacterium]
MYSNESLDRIAKIKKLKESGVIPYANHYHGKTDIDSIVLSSNSVKTLENIELNGIKNDFQTAGRLMSYKSHGKLAFARICDNTGFIQVCFMNGKFNFNTGKSVVDSLEIGGETKTSYKISEKFLDVGDYIGIKGDLFYTKHGELTILVSEFQILAKSVRPLPEKFHGLTDEETIYRQRYLDLIMNDESYNRIFLRSKFIKVLRDFYDINGFVEIETPILGNSASGAAAAPFITHHNDFDEDFYLRISPETGLKKATVGRFERVVEFARDFRNEGSDPSHMQEFSVIEHYVAWWNYEDNMKFTEDMFDYIFDKLPELNRKLEVKDKEGNKRMVDFKTPFERIDYIDGVKTKSGIDISKYKIGDEDELKNTIRDAGIEFEGMDNMLVPTLIDYLYKKVLRPSIVGPAFIYNFPKAMQPLARQSDEDGNIVEQFQLLVNGWEILKAYSELVDPEIQRMNFYEQAKAKELGDNEATTSDDDFVYAMEYGMPPQSGWGMGIERILSILTSQDNLRDVVLFPLMKSENKDITMGKSKRTKIAVAIINKALCTEKWMELNTVGHLNVAFGARVGKELFLQDKIVTHDGIDIKLNIQHAIIIKQTNSNDELKDLLKLAKSEGIEVSEFTKEMLEITDDKKVINITSNKFFDDVEYFGVLLFGDKEKIESITSEFPLYS